MNLTRDLSKYRFLKSQVLGRLWMIPVLLATMVHQNVLQNGFGWDDEAIIQSISTPDHWSDLFLSYSRDEDSPKAATPYYRPMIALSYLTDLMIWGKTPYGFHFSVWLAHILNAGLVFLLARQLLIVQGRIGYNRASIPSWGAPIYPFTVALLFAVHPIHSEAVAWIAGRNDVFCTTLILISINFYLGTLRTVGMATPLSRWRWFLYGGSMMFFLLALFTKETAAGLLILFPLADAILGGPLAKRWKGWAARSVLPLFLFLVYFVMRSGAIELPLGVGDSANAVSDPVHWSILDAIRGYGFYMALVLWPYPHDPFIASFPGSGLLAGFHFVLALLALAWTLNAIRHRQVLSGIGMAWMFCLLSPAILAGYLNLAAAPLAERYGYGASVGVLLAVVWVLLLGFQWILNGTRTTTVQRFALVPLGMLILVILIWGVESAGRNTIWKNPITFWKKAAESSYDTGYPHRALGIEYARWGYNDQAEASYRRAIAVDEARLGLDHLEVASSLNNLSVLYFNQGRYEEAEPLSLRSLAIWEAQRGPGHSDVAINLQNLGVLYRNQGRYAESESAFRRSLAIQVENMGETHLVVGAGHRNLARLFELQGRYAEAKSHYHRAVGIWEKALGPNHPMVADLRETYRRLLDRPISSGSKLKTSSESL